MNTQNDDSIKSDKGNAETGVRISTKATAVFGAEMLNTAAKQS